MRDTDRDWSKLAAEEPFWAVLSSDAFRGATLTDDKVRAFFRTGERIVTDLFGFIKHNLEPGFDPRRSLDFGCGLGRLLIPIARLSGEAVGVDVAPCMLERCSAFLSERQVTNVTLVAGDDDLTGVTGEFDFINSYIVFQHIPPARGYRLIENLLKRLKVGGVAAIHLTYARSRRLLEHEARHARFYRREDGAMIDVVPLPDDVPAGTMLMFDYDLNSVFALLSMYASHPILALPTIRDHLGVNFVFRRGP